MYGLDSFVSPPPISTIVSIFLIIACDGIGTFFLKVSGLQVIKPECLRWQAPLIGAAILCTILYPLALMGFAGLFIFKTLGLGLIIIALFHLYNLRTNATRRLTPSFFQLLNNAWQNSFLGKIFVLLLLTYGVFSLSPITQSDSLDYHVGVALHILNTGSMPITPEWFHSRLAGNGEILIAIGLALGAEQFGSLLQFSGLLGIAGLLFHSRPVGNMSKQENRREKDWRNTITISAISAPALVFLVGGAKPQLLAIGMTSLGLYLTVSLLKYYDDKNLLLKSFSLVCILVMVASQSKFSYLLGGGIIGLLSLIYMSRKRLLSHALLIGSLSAVIILLPPVLWKSINFGGGYIDALLTPFPGGWPGTDRFEEGLRNYRDSLIWFPFSLLIPDRIETITSILGFGCLGCLLLRPDKDSTVWVIALASCIVFVLAAMLGPLASRTYMEPFFWILFGLTLQKPHTLFIKHPKIIQAPVFLQSMLVISILAYGITTAIPGAFSSSFRHQTMTALSDGYEIMKWVDQALPKNAILLSSHHSLGLATRKAVSLDWAKHTEAKSEEFSRYLERIKDEKVTHLLLYGENVSKSKLYKTFLNCLGTEKIGPGFGHRATRNPFNIGKTYEAWLYSFDYKRLPGCVHF